jgi:hypothetical protein
LVIRYFDAPAGAGKTRALARYAHKLVTNRRKVLFVQPTIDLINRTISGEIAPLAPIYPVTPLHSGVLAGKGVVKSLMAHFEAAAPGGEIVFTTHSALLRAPFLKNRGQWIVLIDEAPTIEAFKQHSLPETHRIITDHIDLEPTGPVYGRLVSRGRAGMSINHIVDNEHDDDVLEVFRDVAQRIKSPHWDVYALQSGFHRMIDGDKDNGGLTTWSVMKPSVLEGFKAVVVASAMFRDTLFYRLWTQRDDVKMKPVGKKLTELLRYNAHSNGSLMTIFYLSEEGWSKRFRDREVEHDGRVVPLQDLVFRAVEGQFQREPFAWMANKDIPDGKFSHLPGAVRLPNSPHGLNNFQHLHNVTVLSALNPPSAHFDFLAMQGVNEDEVRTSCYRSAVYQAVMRISIRNPHDTTPKQVLIMDRATAEWLADLFPGAQVEQISSEVLEVRKGRPGRRRQHATSADRTRAYRLEEKQRLLNELSALNTGSLMEAAYPDLEEAARQVGPDTKCCDENPFNKEISSHDFVPRYGSAYTSLYDVKSPIYVDLEDDEAFIDLLCRMHKEVYPSKEHNLVFSPADMDPQAEGATTKRGKDNIRHLRGVWLDNDGGDLTHSEFARIFPFLRVVVWNTYSSTADKQRWRAFIPTSHAMSIDVHQLVIRQIEQALKKEGYWGDKQIKNNRVKSPLRHGFDESKFNAASVFYLPCQAKDPAHSFFIDYNDRRRGPLDLPTWIEHCILDLRPDPDPELPSAPTGPSLAPPGASSLCTQNVSGRLRLIQEKLLSDMQNRFANRRQAMIDQALDAWRWTPPGEGNKGFFRLGLALRNAGLTDSEIANELHSALAFARSPDDRRREIKGIICSLKKRGRLARR